MWTSTNLYKAIIKLLVILCLVLSSSQAHAKLRIAYIESGNYIDNNLILQETVRWLADMDIIQNGSSNLPLSATNKELWQWLAKNAGGDKVEFVADAFFSANWNSTLLNKQIVSLRNRIAKNKDIDLIFTFGTSAGVTISKRITNVNIMNFTSDNPLLQKVNSMPGVISKNVHTKSESSNVLQQLDLFKSIFDFKRLGICYEDSIEGRETIAYEQIVNAATLYNFQIVEEKISSLDDSIENNVQALRQCHAKLATKADAIYLTESIDIALGNSKYNLPIILEPLVEHKIPSFSQRGAEDVAYGALLGLIPSDFSDIGYFEASVLRQIVDGKKPSEINEVFEGSYRLALNLAMAQKINWPVSLEILSSLDRIYFQIQ